jgi:hypothetical protein
VHIPQKALSSYPQPVTHPLFNREINLFCNVPLPRLSAIALLLPLRRVRAVAAWLQITLQAGICLSGNYNFFNLLTALLACCCLRDEQLPRFLQSFASTAIQQPHEVHPLASHKTAHPLRAFSILQRVLPCLLPFFLFTYMFTIVAPSLGVVRITAAELSPPPSLLRVYSMLLGWTIQFRNFDASMFHVEAAAVLTAFVAVALFSAAADTSREMLDPFHSPPPSALPKVEELSQRLQSSSLSPSSRIKRAVIVVSSGVSLVLCSILLLVIIVPFSWTVSLPFLPNYALQLHAITATGRVSSSYGTLTVMTAFIFKLSFLRSVPLDDRRRQRSQH